MSVTHPPTESKPLLDPAEEQQDVKTLLKQLAWVRDKFRRAQKQVRPGSWEYWVFSGLGHAIDVTHPKVKKIMEKHPEAAGKKFDSGKVRLDLVPTHPVKEVARVLMHGAAKYGDHNWRGGIAYSRLYAATLRHLTAFWEGEDIDPESGLHHLAHAACEIFFLIEMVTRRPELDDRYRLPKEATSE